MPKHSDKFRAKKPSFLKDSYTKKYFGRLKLVSATREPLLVFAKQCYVTQKEHHRGTWIINIL